MTGRIGHAVRRARARLGAVGRRVPLPIAAGAIAGLVVLALGIGGDETFVARTGLAVDPAGGQVSPLTRRALALLPIRSVAPPVRPTAFLITGDRGLAAVAFQTAEQLGKPGADAGARIADAVVVHDTGGDPLTFSTTPPPRRLRITATATDPNRAAGIANAYATALFGYRLDLYGELLGDVRDGLELRLRLLPAASGATSLERVRLRRDLALVRRATRQETFRVNREAVARLPGAPDSPHLLRDALVAALAGALLVVFVRLLRAPGPRPSRHGSSSLRAGAS